MQSLRPPDLLQSECRQRLRGIQMYEMRQNCSGKPLPEKSQKAGQLSVSANC